VHWKLKHKGHLEIIYIRDKNITGPLQSYDIQVKLDGKILPFDKSTFVKIEVNKPPEVTLTMLPENVIINLDGIKYEIGEQESE
jgi:hypothetical protein